MNNDQFRRLLLANTSKSKSQSNPSPNNNGASSPPASSRPSSTAALGSRLKSSIPMTPRSVTGSAGSNTNRSTFARQLAEQNQAPDQNNKPKNKNQFRSFAPKGSKPAQGYVDRARTREEQEDDERAARLKVLEESFKKEEMDREMYDRLRAEVAGGDLGSTHLVKGLDFRLLERVRRGEDVFGGGGDGELHNGGGAGGEKEGDGGKGDGIEGEGEDPDDALERLEATEVKAVEREKVQKKGQFATTGLNPGQKRSRNQILAELKAARAAAAAAKAKEAESSLGSRFKKIGEKKTPGTRIERDGKGREVMIIVDEDGHERRKVRKVDPRVAAEEEERERVMLAASGEILGMEVPEEVRKKLEAQKAEEEGKKEIESIFEDAGSDYNPLAGLEGSDESSEEEGEAEEGRTKEEKPQIKATSTAMPPPPRPIPNNATTPASRNYFQDSKTALTSSETYKAPSLDDPAFRAALQKAKAAGALEKSAEEQKAAEREARLKQKLSELHRDDEDMDMGFGSSRVEDEADLEEGGGKVKLSTWGGSDGDGDEEGGGGGSGKTQQRKRGGKKRKGDKNNFEDVMRVMQRQKSS